MGIEAACSVVYRTSLHSHFAFGCDRTRLVVESILYRDSQIVLCEHRPWTVVQTAGTDADIVGSRDFTALIVDVLGLEVRVLGINHPTLVGYIAGVNIDLTIGRRDGGLNGFTSRIFHTDIGIVV